MFQLIFESVIEKQLSKTTKSIDILIELSRTLSKKIESRVKILKSSIDRISNIIETLIKLFATTLTSEKDVAI